MNNLINKIAVVTGGNSGIGYATAKELKAQGATVVITGRRPDALAKAASELGITGIVADQSSLTATDELVAEIKKKSGMVDLLFINAGIYELSTVEAANEKHFDDIMNINFKGAFFTLSKFIPLLNDGGSVVFLSSISASTSTAGGSIYSASKAALNAVMRTSAVELAPRKIRVNAVSPGPTDTEVFNKYRFDKATIIALKEKLLAKVLLKRMGTTTEVAKLVVYLFGEDAGFITGSEFVIDGGKMQA